MSPVKMTERMDVDFEVALILLHMSSGLMWSEFIKLFGQRHPDILQRIKAGKINNALKSNSVASTSGVQSTPNNSKPSGTGLAKRAPRPRKLVTLKINNTAKPKKAADNKVKSKAVANNPIAKRKMIAKRPKREAAIIEKLRLHFMSLPSRGFFKQEFLQKFVQN